MPKIPVLKPWEVARLLAAFQFREVRKKARINNFVMRTEERQRFLFIRGETFRRFFCGKSQKTSGLRLRN